MRKVKETGSVFLVVASLVTVLLLVFSTAVHHKRISELERHVNDLQLAGKARTYRLDDLEAALAKQGQELAVVRQLQADSASMQMILRDRMRLHRIAINDHAAGGKVWIERCDKLSEYPERLDLTAEDKAFLKGRVVE